MMIQIEPSNGLAIYDQVVRQIKFAIAQGSVREGELVPSVRELARGLAINPNTVARAYRQLQDDQILESIRGTGLAVRKSSAVKCRKERKDLIRERIRQVLLEAQHSQLETGQIRELVESELKAIEKREV